MKTAAQLDADIASEISRADLIRAAHAAAASLFVGKRKLPPALVHRARLLAFEAVRRRDWRAGTSDHPHAPHSAGIAAIADEGVDEATAAWARIWKR